MNKDQIEIITQYLKIETNYAVIINGQYGVGKTHFYKNQLAPKIKEISLLKDDKKKFIPIHISLFGYNSIDEIQTAILVELYSILKNKKLKIITGFAKSFIDKYIGEFYQDAGDWLDYENMVVCFDDLDRKSNVLKLQDVFGFINSLVENQKAKILIIANEEELLKDTSYVLSLKEKVIGVSILYEPNVVEVYQQIIKERYSHSHGIYYNFLKENSSHIISIIEINKNNFRNLIFFLEHFKIIFDLIEDLFQIDKDFSILKSEKQKAILDFTLAITIEYKLGVLNSTNYEIIKKFNNESFIEIDIKKAFEKRSDEDGSILSEKKYIEIFRDKYYSNSKYYFFESIFQYITGKKSFKIVDLKNELETFFIVKDGEVPRHEKVLADLMYFGCVNLTNKEYKNLTNEMLTFADKGIYQLRQYATVFHFAVRFDNILNFDISKLKSRIKKGVKKGISKYTYIQDLGFYISVRDESKIDEKEIVDFCIEINEIVKKDNDSKEIELFYNLFLVNYNEFIQVVDTDDFKFRFEPFWNQINVKNLCFKIKRMDNSQIWGLGRYFLKRYRREIFERILPEKNFVIQLKKLIDEKTKVRKNKNLRNASLDYLSECLGESILNFPE